VSDPNIETIEFDPVPEEPSGPTRLNVAEWVEDERIRRVFYWVAGALVAYTVVERLWNPPFGIIIRGAVAGGLYALVALGIALIYRANRIINFAQGDIGGVPAALSVMLISALHWPYPAGIAVGLASGIVIGVLVEFVVIRRFSRAPRLVLTVATIGIAQILTFVEIIMPHWFHANSAPTSFPSPFNFGFDIGGIRFHGNDILAIIAIPAALAGLAFFLNKTHIGVAVRACAESSDRASLLGVPVKRVNLVVWVVAAELAAVSMILRAGVAGLPFGSALGLSVLLRTLAAACLGRMEKMPTIVGASLALGIVEQSAIWGTHQSEVVDLIIFIVIIAALLVQRAGLASRAQEAASSSWTAFREVRPLPTELARRPEVQWTRRALVVLGGVLVLVMPKLIGQARTDLASFLAAYLIIALSLLVLAGWAGQISLGQFAFVGVGSAASAWMTLHWHVDILVGMLAAGVLSAIVAVAIGIPALRIRGLFLAVATLAFTFACSSYLLNRNFFGWIPDEFTDLPRLPLFGRIQIASTDRFYYFSYVVLLACILGVRAMRRSRVGRVLIATRENERGVQAYGINVTRAKLVAFAVSGFLAGVAGVLIVHQQGAVYPDLADPQSSVQVLVMVIIGGLGSMTGVFAGAIYLEGLSWFQGSVPHALQGVLQILGTGVGLVIILMFLPDGVGSLIYRGRDRLLRELADRRNIIVPSLFADMAVRSEEDVVVASTPVLTPSVPTNGNGSRAKKKVTT
jgi:branched-chain amino acid transport system permease protein